MDLRHLSVELTEDEIDDKGRELARLLVLHERAEAAEKDRAKAAKDAIKLQAIEIAKLQHVVHNGAEVRPVEVVTRYDYVHSVARVIRVDTGETVETRAMTAAEKQEEMFPRSRVEVVGPGRRDGDPPAADVRSSKRPSKVSTKTEAAVDAAMDAEA